MQLPLKNVRLLAPAGGGEFLDRVFDHFTRFAGEFLNPANQFFLIREGAVALEIDALDRGTLVIETLHRDDVVGWSWLFEPYRWQFDARASGPTRVVAFDGACLRGKCEADHELGYQLMRRFAASLIERLQATRLQLLDVYGHARTP